jgi:signal transduction histidine kinase
MRRHFPRQRFSVRDQVLVRVVPAFVLAAALVALVGRWGYVRWAQEAAPDQRGAVLLCVATAVGIALAAVAGAVIGTVRVVDRVSARLARLGAHMEGLARGDDTTRLPRGAADEVGRLEGYFNLMAASLEEAHREAGSQAVRLQVALENQRLLDKAKDDFLVLISHEVRTPLTSVLGGVNILKNAVERAEPADRAVLERLNLPEVAGIIASSGQRLGGFLTDAIQMTTIQSGERHLELTPVAPADLFSAALHRVRPWAAARGISVACRACDGAPWDLLCDSTVLGVAVGKIIDNAVVHNLDGGAVTVGEVDTVPGHGGPADVVTPDMPQRLQDQPGWRPWADEDIAWRIFEVHNSGRAIPESRLGSLFGKFELVGRIEHHTRGSGLSLPIAKAAVEQHGGRILVRSEEGWGTSFYLVLPTVPAGAAGRVWGRSGDDAAEGLGGRAGHEQVGVPAHGAWLEIELDHACSRRTGRGHQAGGGVDGPGRADHQEQTAR